MKNKQFNITIYLLSISFGLCLFLYIMLMTAQQPEQLHTFQNVAIYYSDDNGYIIDEDGRRFDVDFDCKNESVIFVTYDNKNTVMRLDDEVISYEIIK